MKKQDILTNLESINDDIEITGEILGFAKPKEFDINEITLDQFKNVLENNKQINGYYQSTLDGKVSKGINTFKEKTMPTLIEEAIKAKSTEGLTPEQIKLRELEKQLADMQAEKTKAELLNANTAKLKEKNLDIGLAKYINSDEDVDFFSNLISNSIQNGVKEKLGDSNYTPPKTDNNSFGKIQWQDVIDGKSSYEDFMKQENK